jgi:hypothetical protein
MSFYDFEVTGPCAVLTHAEAEDYSASIPGGSFVAKVPVQNTISVTSNPANGNAPRLL